MASLDCKPPDPTVNLRKGKSKYENVFFVVSVRLSNFCLFYFNIMKFELLTRNILSMKVLDVWNIQVSWRTINLDGGFNFATKRFRCIIKFIINELITTP